MKDKSDFMPLIPKMKEWLGIKGITFFRDLKSEYNTVSAVWIEDGIPHAVHFREGTQIRNKLRELTNYSWTSHKYDDTWAEIIEECIK